MQLVSPGAAVGAAVGLAVGDAVGDAVVPVAVVVLAGGAVVPAAAVVVVSVHVWSTLDTPHWPSSGKFVRPVTSGWHVSPLGVTCL